MGGILVVEDSLEVQILLRKTLSGILGEAVIASTAAEARKCLETQEFELILLDIGLPDGDGFELCGELQANEKTRFVPVMFLTGKTEVTYKVTAFAMGADDYIEKPFNALELRARVAAKLKKTAIHRESGQILTRGKLRLDATTQRASLLNDGGSATPIHLTPNEFKLLFHLAKAEDRIFTRDQLLSAIWGENAEVFDRTVDSNISAIRRKLGSLAYYIESVQGQGYRFLSVSDNRAAA
jgi:two-component system phosphate regulon response regulator PhoB